MVYKLRKTERGMKRLQAEKEALEGKGKGKGEEGEEQGELHAGLGWLHYRESFFFLFRESEKRFFGLVGCNASSLAENRLLSLIKQKLYCHMLQH